MFRVTRALRAAGGGHGAGHGSAYGGASAAPRRARARPM
jgi:hypothetical protein